MHDVIQRVNEAIKGLTVFLLGKQKQDGSWRFCFENGTIIDAYVIILFRIVGYEEEALIRQLHDRILSRQQPNGSWQWYRDETEGNLSASVEAYYALLYSGYSKAEDDVMQRAAHYIGAHGGIGNVSSILTQSILAATGQRKWPLSLTSIPMEVMLLPDDFPVNIYQFSGYARVHLIPMLIMASQNWSLRDERTPHLTKLLSSSHVERGERDQLGDDLSHKEMLSAIHAGTRHLIGSPRSLRDVALEKAEKFMLDRIEGDGSLYSYATSTVLLVLSLLALGYKKDHDLILNACRGLANMRCAADGYQTIQNSPSAVWDTALITYTLQQAGTPSIHPTMLNAYRYLLERQHQKKGDWSKHNPHVEPGGWGFSDSNTINPDVDDSTAALRAIYGLSKTDPQMKEAWNRGLQWVLSMQNKDGGWPAFEKNTNSRMLTWLAIDGAKSAAIDPSEADLTGRTLEYLGHFAHLHTNAHPFIKKGADRLIRHQRDDGSWYGRWGVCYLYGTWAAVTGLVAAGLSKDHKTIQRAVRWLHRIQNKDGGWGESCRSDRMQRYVPLGASTPSQTAWALDALIAVSPRPTPGIDRGIDRLISLLHEESWATVYPTGAGLPGHFYIHYHSYRYIWPLLALAHYKSKYGSDN